MGRMNRAPALALAAALALGAQGLAPAVALADGSGSGSTDVTVQLLEAEDDGTASADAGDLAQTGAVLPAGAVALAAIGAGGLGATLLLRGRPKRGKEEL